MNETNATIVVNRREVRRYNNVVLLQVGQLNFGVNIKQLHYFIL